MGCVLYIVIDSSQEGHVHVRDAHERRMRGAWRGTDRYRRSLTWQRNLDLRLVLIQKMGCAAKIILTETLPPPPSQAPCIARAPVPTCTLPTQCKGSGGGGGGDASGAAGGGRQAADGERRAAVLQAGGRRRRAQQVCAVLVATAPPRRAAPSGRLETASLSPPPTPPVTGRVVLAKCS